MKDLLNITSVEGNWSKEIHDERIAASATYLSEYPDALVITSGTFAPSPYTSFTDVPLGRYTSRELVAKFSIAPHRIVPGYLLCHGCSYTIIDAYTNACVIGWLASGFLITSNARVRFAPQTSAFHAARVGILNARALRPYTAIGVEVEIVEPSSSVADPLPEEQCRIDALYSLGGLNDTGLWQDAQVVRSLDDLSASRALLFEAFRTMFNVNEVEDLIREEGLLTARLKFVNEWGRRAGPTGSR